MTARSERKKQDKADVDVTDSPYFNASAKVSGISLPEVTEISKVGVITNRIPDIILPEEIPTARLILRRDRQTHFEELGAVVDRMRLSKSGYDCVIVCGKEKVYAHRCVLIAHSEYFERLLFESGDKLMVDVPTDGIPVRGMTAIIDYMYSGDLKINYETAVDTLTTANILEMPDLTEKCSDFIDTLLADENLMTTLELAERTGVNPLYAEAYKRLAKNFYIQTKMPGFLLWDIEKVIRLLSNDHIVIETEVHVFVAAMRWMQYKEKERRQHFKILMDCVRWVYMSTEEMMNCIDQEQDLLKQADIRVLLIDANWYLTLENYHFIWKAYVIPLPRIRSLRKEDPEEVVNRMRVSLVAKHSSMDHVWRAKEATNGITKDRPSSKAAVHQESSKKDSSNKQRRQAASLPASDPEKAARTADAQKATPRKASDSAIAASPKTAPSPNNAPSPNTAVSPKVPPSPKAPSAANTRPNSAGTAATARSKKREKEEKPAKVEKVEESPAKSPRGEKFALFKKKPKKKGR